MKILYKPFLRKGLLTLVLAFSLQSMHKVQAQVFTDLTVLESEVTNLPAGTTITWHTAAVASVGNLVTDPASVVAPGTYYMAFFDSVNSCYSPTVAVPVVTNTTPSATADLSSLTVGNIPTSTSISYHTNKVANSSNELANLTTVENAGVYYAAFKDAVNSCYSSDSSPVIVAIDILAEVMITQVYHSATLGRVIEVTNLSSTLSVPANKLIIGMYADKIGDQTKIIPDELYTVSSALSPGQSAIISTGSLSGITINSGAVQETTSTVTNFSDGDDLLILSISSDANSWANKKDISETFANNTSYVRNDEITSGNTSYTGSEWIAFVDDTLDPYRALTSGGPERHPHDPVLSEINNPNSESNIMLGLHRAGITSRTAAAWTNGYPDRTRRVSIEEDYSHTSSALSARILTVDNSSKLSITNDALIVSEQINLTGTNDEIRMINGSQLITTHTSASQITGNGKLYVDQDSDIPSLYRYNYFGSPVNSVGQTTYSVADVLKDGTNPTSESSTPLNINFISGYDGDGATSPISLAEYWIYTYGASAAWNQALSGGAIPQTDGYIFKGPGQAQNYTFVGTPKDGTLQTTVAASTSYLLGNPYASAIRSQKFIEDNLTSTTGTLYFWEQKESANGEVDQSGHNYGGYVGGYAIRNIAMGIAANNVIGEDSSTGAAGLGEGTYQEPAPYIAIGQGFFVGGSATGGTIEFNNSQREFIQEGAQSVFFRNPQPADNSQQHLSALKIGMDYIHQDEEQELHRQIGISFIEGNTFEYEKGYDSPAFDLGTTDIYWDFESDDTPYFIAGVGAIEGDMEIPFTVIMDYTGEVHLSLDEWDHIDREVYIFDKLEGIYHHVNESKATLNLTIGEYKNRFVLLLSNEVLSVNTPDSTNSLLSIFSDNIQQEIVVRNYNDLSIEGVRLYDILGKEIHQWNEDMNNEPELRMKLKKKLHGVYIIQVKTDKRVISKKLYLKS